MMSLQEMRRRLVPVFYVIGALGALFLFLWALGGHIENQNAWEEGILRAAMDGEFPNGTWRGIDTPFGGDKKAMIEHPNWDEGYDDGQPIGGGVVDYISYRIDFLYILGGINFYRVSWVREPRQLCEVVVATSIHPMFGRVLSTKYSEPCYKGGGN